MRYLSTIASGLSRSVRNVGTAANSLQAKS